MSVSGFSRVWYAFTTIGIFIQNKVVSRVILRKMQR